MRGLVPQPGSHHHEADRYPSSEAFGPTFSPHGDLCVSLLLVWGFDMGGAEGVFGVSKLGYAIGLGGVSSA